MTTNERLIAQYESAIRTIEECRDLVPLPAVLDRLAAQCRTHIAGLRRETVIDWEADDGTA